MITPAMIKEVLNDDVTKKLEASIIDLNENIERPPSVLYIRQAVATSTKQKRIFTLGNMSTITGFAKSRKSFLMTLFAGAILRGRDESGILISENEIDGKDLVIYVDTEQGKYDCQQLGKRILHIGQSDKFILLNLRSCEPAERLLIFEKLFELHGKRIKFCVLDGIADLSCKGVNDEEESIKLVSMLMRLSNDYQCHISCILHLNKKGEVTGHIGSQVMKKSEIIISVAKQKGKYSSDVKCNMSRGEDFEPFVLSIDEGLPYIDTQAKTTTEEESEDVPF